MFDNMQWFNPPAKTSVDGSRLRVTSAASSDFWRITHYGFIRDNGHFLYQELTSDFSVEIRVDGAYRDLYDQAGLMLRVDAENWIKTGIEYVEGRQYLSVVVTRGFSDWSVIALDKAPPSLWLRVTRKAEAVEVFYSLDGQQYHMMRMAYLVPSPISQAGPMCASPDGRGFEVVFSEYKTQAIK